MFSCPAILLWVLLVVSSAYAHLAPIHYTLSRRGGSYPTPEIANLSSLVEQLQAVESRYNATTRELGSNTVVRKPRRKHGTQASTVLLGELGREGSWYTTLELGEPSQQVLLDLDMLTADWRVQSTSSNLGSIFLDFASKTYRDSKEPLAFPTCRHPTDLLHLSGINRMVPVSFAHCRPAQHWVQALQPSGAYLGLAPSSSLSQLNTTSLMPQLIEQGVIDLPMWSLVLLNGQDGLLSIGGTMLQRIREVEKETQDLLSDHKTHEELKRSLEERGEGDPLGHDNIDNEWKWLEVRGSDGWWQIQLHGIWVDGTKILYNQPAILDVNTPFILAPPMAARAFYSTASGSRRLPPPYDQFHAYPCLSPPQIHFDFAGWTVEVLKGRRLFSPGGRFSLGRMAPGSGYCVGMIVESRMGLSTLSETKNGVTLPYNSRDGLSDVWIVGEPFFRDVQVAFEWKSKRVGLQRV